MDIPLLTDGVVRLRPLQPDDAEAHVAAEDEDQIRWLSGGVSTAEGVRAWIHLNHDEWSKDGPRLNFAIWDVASAQLAGNAEANLALEGLDPGEVNLSYAVTPAFRGRGYAARAVRLLCSWLARERLGDIAVIRIEPDNVHSFNVPLDAGFARVGTTKSPKGETLVRHERLLRRPCVRTAIPDDASAIGDIHVRSWRMAYDGLLPDDYLASLSSHERASAWRQWLEDKVNDVVLVIESTIGDIAGFASARHVDDRSGEAELHTLYLDPSVVGKGYGPLLHEAMMKRLGLLGFTRVTLWVHPENRRARRFYEREGWTPTGEESTETVWDQPMPAVHYQRRPT